MDESEVLRFEQQKQITKLSEAIREGAKLRPQCFIGTAHDGAACVNLSAAEALGFVYSEWSTWTQVRAFLTDRGFPCMVLNQALHWNDADRLSREEIADKLEALGY